MPLCQDVTLQLDGSGNGTLTTGDVDNGSSDNCDLTPTLTLSQTAFDCSHVGSNTVTLTVEDDNSNTATCTATITVEDTVDPTALCQDVTLQLDGSGNGTLTTGDVDNGSSDNCDATPTLTLSQTAFDCSHVGTQHGNLNGRR